MVKKGFRKEAGGVYDVYSTFILPCRIRPGAGNVQMNFLIFLQHQLNSLTKI